MQVDEQLSLGRRSLRTRPGTLLLGPTGARLWADYLDDVPGFAGAIDFIHKLNIPLLFTVAQGVSTPPLPSEANWRPSHLSTSQRFGALELNEQRFITWDDVAVSLQRWTNTGTSPQTLRLEVDPEWITPLAPGSFDGERAILARGFTLRARIATSVPGLVDGLTLAPGATVEFTIAAALGLAETDTPDDLAARLTAFLTDPPEALIARQIADYQSWFDRAPSFSSSSPVLDRLWSYRWFLLRHNLAEPRFGDFTGRLFYEGRSHKMSKTPWAPQGWEFSKLIPLSSPMHLIESRWHADSGIGADVLASLATTQGADGQLYSRTLNETMHPYANFAGWGTYQYALARGLGAGIAAALPLFKRQVDGEEQYLATGGDSLPIQIDHRLTGKEYQPSYWYFHGFPDDALDKATYDPLKRVDRAIYQHLNARGVAALSAHLGDQEAERFSALAATIAHAVLTKQWDADTGFFYDLHHLTDEKAFVRNVVGFYPYWAGITGPEHLGGFLAALTPEFFDTPAPLPSVARDCPVFMPGGSWKGSFLKGRNGCMWDGPTWPYTNSVALDAIATVTRSDAHHHDALFAHFFWKYALLHFAGQDGRTPYLVEHYDSMTGEPISDEPDYNHSYLIDLVMRHVVGIELDTGTALRLDPVDIGLEHFAVDNIDIRGCKLAVRYDRETGFRLFADSREVAARPDLGPLSWNGLPPL